MLRQLTQILAVSIAFESARTLAPLFGLHIAHLPGVADRRHNRVNIREIDRHQREASCSIRRDEAIFERCLQEAPGLLWITNTSSDPASLHATVSWAGQDNKQGIGKGSVHNMTWTQHDEGCLT